MSTAKFIKYQSADRYVALRLGSYSRWILRKDIGIVIHSTSFSTLFLLANILISGVDIIHVWENKEYIYVFQGITLFVMRFCLLGEVLLFLSIVFRKTTIAYTIAFGMSLSLDSRVSYMGYWGALWPQYHLSSENFGLAIVYFATMLCFIVYINRKVYSLKDVFWV